MVASLSLSLERERATIINLPVLRNLAIQEIYGLIASRGTSLVDLRYVRGYICSCLLLIDIAKYDIYDLQLSASQC